ncbi:uncharacterized protein LOC102806426 [Saccoglossus kowalevskii]|uniref:Uncharacterized protein LOC102806426 n=1 Tax=Saccoglossus kowalevskii TaxID=10224 RepID=A0ABM0MUJ6_SACKO|nr:PREDICTED: uncharacterized protein LOC102806426 [Saccoglossus kowalevskii]
MILKAGCTVIAFTRWGFLTGICVTVTGILGCLSGYTKNKGTIIGNMVMSIIVAILAGGALVVNSFGVGAQQRCNFDILLLFTYLCDNDRYATCVASYSINLIASFGAAIIAIIAACVCGRAVCIRGVQQTVVVNSPPPATMQVQVQHTSGYNYPPQQQPQPTMMMMPQVQVTQQTQPQPVFQQQAQDFRQQQPPQHNVGARNVVGSPSPPPSYSSTDSNAYVADTQKVPLLQ